MSSEICLELVDSLAYTGEQSTTGKVSEADEGKSGILERNGFVWYASGSLLEVFNIDSDFKVIHWNFNDCTRRAWKSKTCTVECVEELVAFQRPLLAVGLRLGPEQTQIMLLSPQGVYEVGNVNIQEDVNIIRFIDPSSCSLGVLRHYSGCLAVGTIDGKVIMVDLCLNLVENGNFGSKIAMNDETKKQCHIEFNGGDSKVLVRNHEKIRERGLYFGLQFSHDVDASVESILDVPPLKACCVGFADGTILIVDLVDQSLMHRIVPPSEDCAVIAMNFVEPSDDPMACLYLWAFYAHDDGAFALLHMIMCEEKLLQDGVSVYEQFQSCSTRLSLPSYDPGSVPLQVQSVTKQIGEDELITLNVLSWLGSDLTTTVLVFDLNQWYKAEMPYECDWQDELTHMVVFKLNEPSFYAQLEERSLKPFYSIQRPEEHFYPNSLEFDIANFNGFHRTRYRWIGLQKKLLRYLDLDGANGVIEPSSLYQVLNRAALMPLFYDQLPCDDDGTKMQREFILSLGLEYNCHAFLQSCVCLWADGSHLGADPERGVSLSTLTDWIWNRSAALKELSNRTLAPFLDCSGPRVDPHTNRNLSHCTEQMKRLARLYSTILSDCKKVIPKEVLKKLTKECTSIAVAAQYQDILLWLLSIGLLPEVPEPPQDADAGEEPNENSLPTGTLRVPYPYTSLDEFYRMQRAALHDEEGDAGSSEAAGSYKMLFIDNLIEREFDPASIRKVWFDESDIANEGALLYPPQSLQKALRVLLIPEAAMQQKLVLLLYLFMDIEAVVGGERYGKIFDDLENFYYLYNMDHDVVHRVKAFWHLDHGSVETAVEHFLQPVSVKVDHPRWHRELAVTVLLRLDAPQEALLLLQNRGCHVPPQLELITLVRNNRIDDAYRLQRRQPQPDGMLWFAEAVLREGKAKALLEIGFTDEEKHWLRNHLRECPLSVCDSLLFGHLLLNGEFVEAIQHVDRVTTRRRSDGTEAYRDILSLYHKALDPTSQRLAYLTYAEPKELEPRLTVPTSPGGQPTAETLSARLIRNRADFRVRILHQSIVATKEAAEATGLLHERPFLDRPDLGVFQRRPMVRSSNVSYPILVTNSSKGTKRRRDECDDSYDAASMDRRRAQHFDEDDAYRNPSKRRNLGVEGRRYANLDTPVPVIPQIRPMVPKFNFTAATASATFSAGGSDRSSESHHQAQSVSHSPSIFLQTPPLVRRDRNDAESPAFEAGGSYTPPGILKPTQSGLTFAVQDGEEKVLRFVLPADAEGATVDGASCPEETVTELEATSNEQPQPEQRTPRRDLDLSGISNEDFYSPEVTMDDNSLQQLLCSGGPSRRRPLHDSSLSVTPNGSNIAIIIEDHVDDECPNVADEPVDYEQMEVDDDVQVAEDVVQGMAFSEEQQANAPSAIEEEEEEEEEIILLEDSVHGVDELNVKEAIETSTVAVRPSVQQQQHEQLQHQQHEQWNEEDSCVVVEDDEEDDGDSGESFDNIMPQGEEDDYEVVLDDEEEQEEELSVEDDLGDVQEGDEEEENESYDEDGEDLLNGELDNSGADESDVSGESSSVLEVIDVDDEMFSSSSESSSSSSSSPSGDGGAVQQHATMAPPAAAVADEPQREGVEPREASAVGAQQMHYEEFYSESVPGALFNAEDEDVDEAVEEEEEREQEEEGQTSREQDHDDGHGEGHEGDGQQGEESHYIQVPTTSSSTHRTEAQEIAATSAESSEVEDLSVCQQQDTAPEIADSSVAFVGASGAVRELYVAGEQWEDGVASTSGNEEVVRVAPSATAGTSTAATTTGAVSVPVSTAAQPVQQPFARPKNAHELEVPAMNLSVKPDEAHGSSRKNSKGEENGLTEEARALNLSAGQQELAAQMANAGSNKKRNEHDDDEDDGHDEKVDDGEEEKHAVLDDNEPQCSEEAKTDDKTVPNVEGTEEARENEPQSLDEAQREETSANSEGGERTEAPENEPHSSDEGKVEDRPVPMGEDPLVEAVNEEEKMDITLQVSDEEGEGDMQTPPPIAGPSSTLETRVRNEPAENLDSSGVSTDHGDETAPGATTVKEQDEGGKLIDQKPPVKKTKEALLREQEEEASTSSPRTNVRTRLMIAMEKSSTVSPSLGTPSKRRSLRATSVAPETSHTPLTPSLSRSRRYTSLDNVSGATPDHALPLTPRRSTRRASSLAKELFASSTPHKRPRLQSHSSVESVDRGAGGSVPNSPTDAAAAAAAAMEPPEPSEKSFASSTASSTRRSTRGRKPKEFAAGAESQQPGTGSGPLLSDYSSNRRLTRHQLAVMERSMETMASSSGQGRALRASRLDVSVDAGGESEAESVASNVSNQSSLRSTRSRTTRTATRRSSVETRSNRGGSVREGSVTGGQQQPAEPSELDSDSDHSMMHASQRTTHGLEPIAEEADETLPGTTTTKKRRGRPPKSHK